MRIVLPLLLFFSFGVVLFGQETSAKPAFAPGGIITIPPSIDYESVTNRIDITELLAMLPEPDEALQNDDRFHPEVWATEIRHSRDIWCLQFSCKPVRIIDVDFPNAEGNYDKKKVWYLVYSVKNLGPAGDDVKKINSSLGTAVPAGEERPLPVPSDTTLENVPRSAPMEFRQQPGVFVPQPGNIEPIRFMPQFVLASRLVLKSEAVTDSEADETEWKTETEAVAYIDNVLPLALQKIKIRERMEAMPETSVSIRNKTIAPGQELWGVAMWTDVDPRINEFSIFVSGLTNAYQWLNKDTEDEDGAEPNNRGSGRIIKPRFLKINWWRVGDQHSLNESQIHFGSKDGTMPKSIFEQTSKMSPEDRKRLDEAFGEADKNGDGWISPAEKAIFHLNRQDWLQPTYGYEWLFL
jgi:hypothetical protein